VPRRFRQVDVFGEISYAGNPVAVVLDGEGLSDDEMARIANWTNLSETTFVQMPSQPAADYRVRIFTPAEELPFAGHPTLGTCHAWLEAGGAPAAAEEVAQECAAGLVRVRRGDGRLAFAAPALLRSGAVDPALVDQLAAAGGVAHDAVVAAEWVDNGPGWAALLLDSVEAVLAARPGAGADKLGLVAAYPAGSPCAVEVRAFFAKDGEVAEDPVTGSLNASLAQWLLGSGRLTAPYVASQGTVLGRRGRVHVSAEGGEVWIGGATRTCIEGTIDA
jgi:PhzF family phenazine biosynthesis protein